MDEPKGAEEDAQECGNCAFFEAWERQRDPWRPKGNCRRHAPRVMGDASGNPKSVFPMCAGDAWCGDWEEAE